MAHIKPIKDLRNTNEISAFCHEKDEPVFITKNGYNDLVVMSDECYENLLSKDKSCTKSLINNVKTKEIKNNFGFVRVASATIETHVGDVSNNVKEIKNVIDEALKNNVSVLTFSELTLTGASIKDLVLQDNLLSSALEGLNEILKYSKNKEILLFVGLPLKLCSTIYDVVAVILNGKLLGICPKVSDSSFNSYIKGYSGEAKNLKLLNQEALFGINQLFVLENYPDCKIAVEIGEDRNLLDNPSKEAVLNGATLIVSPSFEVETYETEERIDETLKTMTRKYHCAYLFAGSSKDESTTDVLSASRRYLFEDGYLIKSNTSLDNGILIAECDLDKITNIRIKNNLRKSLNSYNRIGFELDTRLDNLVNIIYNAPFEETDDLDARCQRILHIQALGLAKRLKASHSNRVVLALSGGLDSTVAILACKECFDLLNKDPKDIIAVTIPCFGTSNLTKTNALSLAEALGCTTKVINIGPSIEKHLEDIGHDINVTNVTYENAQARERTQVAMDLANDLGALMVGTGDLSELCLGWCTYGGDHMSMYGVNGSLPKTLMQKVAMYYGKVHPEVKDVLESVVLTPISPELLPLEEGKIAQKTEEKVGPYELIDFYIFYLLKYNFSPKKISFLAEQAFKGIYDKETINKWLKSFLRRFYNSQFKRSCLPDGVKVGDISISPRDGLSMPSDVSNDTLLSDLD